ncbi:MAG TPA: TlpA disulfide reductase family protein [Steroidobacteraceae bacterium]
MSRSRAPLWSALLVFVTGCGTHAEDRVKSLDFSLPALRGGAPIQLAQYRDKIVYVDVWASWCTPCLRSMPELEALREKFHGQRFEVIAVNVDSDAAAARAFLERVGARYPVALDRNGAQMRARIGDEADLAALPVGFLLDGRGNIRLVHRGYSPGQSAFLAEHIETLLAELRVGSDTRR